MGLHTRLCILQLMMFLCLAEKQLWNSQADILLDYFSIGYKASNSTDIPIMDIISNTTSITGIRLGDISTIKRISDVVLETKPNGDTRISGAFKLEKFELKVTSARVDDYNGPAIIKSYNNSAEIAYTIKSPDKAHSCKTKWEEFRLGKFSNITILTPKFTKADPNVTIEFNRRILPALNLYFSTPEFLFNMSRTFDFCTLKKYLFPL